MSQHSQHSFPFKITGSTISRKIEVTLIHLDYLYENLITEKLFYKYFSKIFSIIEEKFIDNFSYKLTASLKWMSNKISISQNGQLQLQSITFVVGFLIILITYLVYLGIGVS